tara:strand:+ start:263 stop:439 length:177 start_codon:yes stop_codon:yes gene_type:complete
MDSKLEFEKIERKNKSWKSQFSKEMNIMMEIITQINSTKGKEKKHWGEVMDLFKAKYR